LARRDVQLISLQKGWGQEQLEAIGGSWPVIDLGERLDADGAFLDSAAIMQLCDVVVTVDTATAHLAGALGVPLWIALTAVPDWRWQLDRKDSPWYPSARLFRQKKAGDWAEVFESIATEIDHARQTGARTRRTAGP
jgi:ADP-heptose:LPS heptosyltransferase